MTTIIPLRPGAGFTFAHLKPRRIWVNWEERLKSEHEKMIKPPINSRTGRLASSTNSKEWSTYKEAEDHDADKIGIVLGQCFDDKYVFGMDLDHCYSTKRKLHTYARAILERFNTYSEVSPSGQGLHLLFAMKREDGDQVKRMLGKNRLTMYVSGEEVALDVGARYYTVTETRLELYPDFLRLVSVEDVQWLLEGYRKKPAADVRPGVAGIERDESDSGYAFRTMMSMAAHGMTFEQAVRELKRGRDRAGDWTRKVDDRQLQRAWEAASKRVEKPASAPRLAAKTEAWEPKLFSLAELQHKKFKALKEIVPDFIVAGLTIVAGPPKIKKSFLLMNIGIAVATGGEFFGKQCRQGRVLYLALEDNERRLKIRASSQMGGLPWPELFIATDEWPRSDEGGLDAIAAWLEKNPDCRLVMIDVLQKFRPHSKRGEGAYEGDYNALTGLHSLCSKKHIGMIVSTHTRKMAADDPFDTVSGTHGITGVADTTLVMSRMGDDDHARLFGRGRDIVKEIDHALEFNQLACKWVVLGETDEVRKSDTRKRVLKALKEHPMSPVELADEVHMKRSAIRNLLMRMMKDGEVSKKGDKYTA